VESAAASLSAAKSKARKPKASSAEGGNKRKEASKGTLYDAEGRVIEAARTGYLVRFLIAAEENCFSFLRGPSFSINTKRECRQ
jgi:hypothetical protein